MYMKSLMKIWDAILEEALKKKKVKLLCNLVLPVEGFRSIIIRLEKN